MWDLSSSNKDRTHVPGVARRTLNHWATREVLRLFFVFDIYLAVSGLSCRRRDLSWVSWDPSLRHLHSLAVALGLQSVWAHSCSKVCGNLSPDLESNPGPLHCKADS